MLEYRAGFIGDVRVYNDLAWVEFDFAGNLVSQSKESALIPAFPADKIAEVIAKIKNMRPALFDTAYLRFNDLPDGGHSKNFATGKIEDGVSCYSLTWDMINQCYKRTGSGLEGAMIAYAMHSSPVYFITGEECGTGSDGEPLLKNTAVLAKAEYNAKKDGYIVK